MNNFRGFTKKNLSRLNRLQTELIDLNKKLEAISDTVSFLNLA